jgi:homoprotocatechuate degradation regulator HpaR
MNKPAVIDEAAAVQERRRLPMRDFAHSLPMALLNAREKVMEEFRPMLREFGLTEQQWRVMRVLVEASPIEATGLAARSRILAPSLSRILQHLEQRGLIARRAVRADQRRAAIRLTAQGRRLFERVAPRSEAHYDAITKALGAGKSKRLFGLLEELVDVLDDRHGQAES